MAVITMNIPDVAGESTVAEHVGELDALAIRETVYVPTPRGTRPGSRTVGRSRFSDIEVTRFRDIGSPKLSAHCSNGTNMGTVVISLFRNLETGVKVYMTYTMENTFVSRIEHETADSSGSAFLPHFNDSADIVPPSSLGLSGSVASVLKSQFGDFMGARVAPRSLVSTIRGQYSNREVERLWLNPNKITWSYTPYVNGTAQGAVSKTWDIDAGEAA